MEVVIFKHDYHMGFTRSTHSEIKKEVLSKYFRRIMTVLSKQTSLNSFVTANYSLIMLSFSK